MLNNFNWAKKNQVVIFSVVIGSLPSVCAPTCVRVPQVNEHVPLHITSMCVGGKNIANREQCTPTKPGENGKN